MKKTTLASGLLVATTLTGTSLAHADEVKETSVTNAQEHHQVTSEPVTQEEVNQAKEAVAKDSQAVATQEKSVSTATQTLKDSQDNLTSAKEAVSQAEILVKEATPEHISSVEDDMAAQMQAIANQTETVTVKASHVTETKDKVATQTRDVKEAEEAVSTAQSDRDMAQADVAQKQAILNGTNGAAIVAEEAQSKTDLSDKEAKVLVAEKALDSAKVADRTRNEGLAQLKQDVSTAQTHQTQAAQDLQESKNTLAQTQTKTSQAKAAYDKASQALSSRNTIRLSADYIQALTDYALHYQEKGKAATETLKALSPILKAQHQFKANPNDPTTAYAINHLPEAIQKDLSWFASDLVNQIREAFGRPTTSVTSSSLDFAKTVAEGYVADNWSFRDVLSIGHDAKAVNQAARALGLKTTSEIDEAKGRQYYENMDSYPVITKTVTLTQAKNMVYDAVMDFLFNGYEFLHAQSLAGLKTDHQGYLGLALSSREGVTGIHLLTVDADKLLANSSFETQALDNPYQAAILQKTYDRAIALYQEVKQALTEAQSLVQTRQTAFNKADHALAQLMQDLKTLEATPLQTPQASANLSAAQEALAKATERYQKAIEALTALTADVKTKEEKLREAKAVLAQKEAVLKDRQAKRDQKRALLEQAKSYLLKAQKALATAQNQLKVLEDQKAQTQTYYQNLLNAPELLQAAQARVRVQEADVAQKEAVLAQALSLLAELKVKVSESRTHYENVLKAYRDFEDRQRQAELAKTYASIVAKGGLPVPLVNSKGQIISYTDGSNVSTQTASLTMTSSQKGTKTKATSLPETGEEKGLLASLLGFSLLLFGAITYRKQNR
ncbi:SEC10/PgrA surface exclusion domain-containing protein [Streptococcus agalactiae]